MTAEGTLRVIDGFQTTLDGAVFLGSHPRPIRLTEGVAYA
jgi:hypothetical protein